MPIKQVKPREAFEILNSDKEAVYLDVRTEREFADGHPVGAINIPVVFIKGPGQMEANPEFLAVAEKILPSDKKLVVGCMAGGRSQRACEILEQNDYSNLANVQGGFGGARDAAGEVVVAGWKAEGLPVSIDTEGCGYADLRKKAGL